LNTPGVAEAMASLFLVALLTGIVMYAYARNVQFAWTLKKHAPQDGTAHQALGSLPLSVQKTIVIQADVDTQTR